MPVRLLQVLPENVTALHSVTLSSPPMCDQSCPDLASAENEKTCMIVFCGQSKFCDSHVHANAQHSAHSSLVPRPTRGPHSACGPGYKATAHAHSLTLTPQCDTFA